MIDDARAPSARGFSLVELLLVVGLITLLVGLLLPTLSAARTSATRTKCLANLKELQYVQTLYAAQNRNLLLYAGDGKASGSWIGHVLRYVAPQAVRSADDIDTVRSDLLRCPADESPYFAEPVYVGSDIYRVTSYGLNNLVTPTHAPMGGLRPRKITELPNTSMLIQFAEIGDTDAYAHADHLHVNSFYLSVAPQLTLNRMGLQLPLNRHVTRPAGWETVLNFGFIDGHAETLTIRRVYTDPTNNLFDPSL
jgi:type II secretory pathway pseudopilin PulG